MGSLASKSQRGGAIQNNKKAVLRRRYIFWN